MASADLFVGIYARRYGHVPKHSQTSVTEAEFWYAAKLRKPIFCFVVDGRHPWPSELVEPEPAQTHLRRLIARSIACWFATRSRGRMSLLAALPHRLADIYSRNLNKMTDVVWSTALSS